MTKPQVILDPAGNPAFAVIPWQEYERLAIAGAEMDLSDEELFDRAMAEDEESFPVAVAERLLAGENPVSVYREHRRLSQNQLAEAANVSTAELLKIEAGGRAHSTGTLAAIAKALRIDLDALI